MQLFKPVTLALSIRYLQAKKKSHFVSFISASSMIGIALGVMVLVTVLSVMNGFNIEIKQRFFNMVPEITINHMSGAIDDWQNLSTKISKIKDINSIAPFVSMQALLTHYGQVVPAIVTGIDIKKSEPIYHLNNKMLLGNLQLKPFGIIIGKVLAENLGVSVGSKVTIMIPSSTMTLAGMVPRFKRFTVAGIFSAGTGFNFDTRLAFIDLDDAKRLMQMQNKVSGLHLKIQDLDKAVELSNIIIQKLPPDYIVENWTEQFGAFFAAVKMEKKMMFLILILLIAVAAFNLVSSLVMMVNDKHCDIAILRTMGATPSMILKIFMFEGMLVGILGTIIGLILGVLLASYATEIVNFLQHLFKVQIISANIYFVDYLPSKIMAVDLLKIGITALIMSFLATIYPSWHASKTIISEALRYE